MSSSLGRRRRALRDDERRLWEKVAESVTPLDRAERRGVDPDPAPEAATAAPAPAEPVVATEPRAVKPPRPAPEPVSAPPAVRPSKRALAGWARAGTRPRDGGADAVMLPRPPALAPIDDRTRRRLVRGTIAVDERLDLHGLTQEAAHSVLRRFLVTARDRGARIVLVITGKGKPGGSAFETHERGVLRRSVPHWLADPSLRDVVVGYEEAHLAHGGAGAVYVRLRRRRDRGEIDR
ncbi:Smr/MutS family protein [Pinisolibacter sp.]|uniref:Smr/MutS family protein n=1 Tax=Pinisolibacter sp. TaxID=2172024 RepID=UPI002FDEE074